MDTKSALPRAKMVFLCLSGSYFRWKEASLLSFCIERPPGVVVISSRRLRSQRLYKPARNYLPIFVSYRQVLYNTLMNPQDQSSGPDRGGNEFQPGHTVSPQSPTPAPAPSGSSPGAPPNIPPSPPPSIPSVPEPQGQSLYHPASDPAVGGQPPDGFAPLPVDPQMQDNGREVVWTASEFIAHEKSPSWFAGLVGVSLVVCALVYLITRDIFNTVIVVIAAIIFGVAANRPPRQMQYAVSDHGIEIGRRFYAYTDFRSFSIVDEGALRSIVFMPLKRFMPVLTIYYDPADEDRIGDVLVAHLPMHEHQHDLTERLMRRIRF